MSLTEFKNDLIEAGGVSSATIENSKLRVTYDAPHNYSTVRGEVRRNYPEIEQVDRQEHPSGQITLIYEEKTV